MIGTKGASGVRCITCLNAITCMKRMRAVATSKHITGHDDVDDLEIDFATAALYLTGLQTVVATVVTSSVSIACCAFLPEAAVSAIRTLVLSSAAGGLLVRKPLRLGRVRGIRLIFDSLRPCVAIYIVSLVLEQLVHSCARDTITPSWRRFVFHSMVLVQIGAGFARARFPLQETDVPFLVTVLSLLVIALLPPPAVVLAGPLCSSPTLGTAAERVVRSFVFALLFSIFVYASAPTTQASCDSLVCVMRASAATLWTLGCNVYLLPLALVQGGLVIFVRIGLEDGDSIFGNSSSVVVGGNIPDSGTYSPVGKDAEIVVDGSGGLSDDEEYARNGAIAAAAASSIANVEESESVVTTVAFGENLVVPSFGSLGTRKFASIGGNGPTASPSELSPEQLEAIALRISS